MTIIIIMVLTKKKTNLDEKSGSNSINNNNITIGPTGLGTLVFDKPIKFFPRSVIYIPVEDVTQIDSYSIIILEKVIKDITTSRKVGFKIKGMICNIYNYIISICAYVDGDGKISMIDFINMQIYRIQNY